MQGIPADIEKSLRTSRVRVRILLAIDELQESYPAELAYAAKTDTKALRWALHGFPPRYRRERALLPLALVARSHGRDGEVYRLTRRGREVAARLRMRGCSL